MLLTVTPVRPMRFVLIPDHYIDAALVAVIPAVLLAWSFSTIVPLWLDERLLLRPKKLWLLFILATAPVGLGAALYHLRNARQVSLKPLILTLATLTMGYDVMLAATPADFLWRKRFLELYVLTDTLTIDVKRRNEMHATLRIMRHEVLSDQLSPVQREHYERMLVFCTLALAHGLDSRDLSIWRWLFRDRSDPQAFQDFLDAIGRPALPAGHQKLVPIKSAQPVPLVSSVNLYTSLLT